MEHVLMVCMFVKPHLTFNFKSKVPCVVFKNIISVSINTCIFFPNVTLCHMPSCTSNFDF